MFSLLCLFIASVVSHFAFEDGDLVLIASAPGHCLPFTYYKKCDPICLHKNGDC